MSIINTDNSSQLVWVVASTLILSRILFSLFKFFFLFFLIDRCLGGFASTGAVVHLAQPVVASPLM